MAEPVQTLKKQGKVKYKFGTSELDLNDYIHNLGTNVQSYLKSKSWNEGLKLEFMNSYKLYIAGLEDLFTNNTNRFSTDDFGSITDATGALNNKDNDGIDDVGSEYYYDNAGNKLTTDDFNLLKKRKQKNYNTFSANQEVASYFNTIGSALKSRVASAPTSSNKFNLNKHGFSSYWNNVNNPTGEEPDLTPYWDKDEVDATGKRGTANRASYLKEQLDLYITHVDQTGDYDFSETPFESKENYLNRLREASTLLANGYNSEDTIALNRAGVGGNFLTKFFQTEADLAKEVKTPLQTEYELAEQEIRDRALAKERLAVIDKNKEELRRAEIDNELDTYIKANPFKRTIYGSTLAEPTYDEEYLDDFLKKQYGDTSELSRKKWMKYGLLNRLLKGEEIEGINSKEHITNTLRHGINLGTLRRVNDSLYVVPGSTNYDNYSTITYNPQTGIYLDLSIILNEELRKYMAYDRILDDIPETPRGGGSRFDDGGVLSMLNGGVYDLEASDAFTKRSLEREKRRKLEKVEKVKEKSETTGRSVEQILKDETPHTEWSNADKLRLGAIGGDVLSLVASMTGVGSVASAGIGAASTAANLAADMLEGMGFWQSLGNNALSYGLDALSVIPFAKAAKVPKMIKTLSRFAPKVIALLGTALGIANGPEIVNSFKKIGSNESLTVSDWRNIANGLLIAIGGTAATHRASKAVSHTNAALSDTHSWLKTNLGYRKVENTDISKLRELSKIGDLNAFLKEKYGVAIPELKSIIRRKGKDTGVLKTQDYYDFDHPVTTYSGDLPLNYTFGAGEKWLGKAQINMPKLGIRNTYNKIVHPLAYKRYKPMSKRNKIDLAILKQFDTNKDFVFRRDGGTLNLNKVRKFAGGGKKVTNTTSKANWFGDMFSSDLMKSWLNTFNADNYNNFNSLQKSWSANLAATKYVPGATPLAYNLGVYDRQALWEGTGTNSVIEGLATNGVIKRVGNTGDNADGKHLDGYFGEQEFLRHGGTKDSWIGKENELKQFLEMLKQKGLSYTLDNKSGMYLLNPIMLPIKPTIPESPSVPKTLEIPKLVSKNTDPAVTKETGLPVNLGKISIGDINPTLAYGLPRAMYADSMNRKMTNMAKEAEVPYLQDPFEVHRYTRSDLNAEMLGERNYASLRNLASKPITSDGSLLTATLLEAEVKGLEARNAGKMQSDLTQRLYDEMAWQQEKENASNRHGTAMLNRLAQLLSLKNKSLMELAYLGKKHNIWDTLGLQMEFDARNKLQEKKALQENFDRVNIDSEVNYNLRNYSQGLLDDTQLAAWDKVLSGDNNLTPEEKLQYLLAAKIAAQVKQNMLMENMGISSKYAGVRSATKPWSWTYSLAPERKEKGGRIEVAGILAKTEDAERFQKLIKESIDRNEKVLDRMSKSLYGYIKASIVK